MGRRTDGAAKPGGEWPEGPLIQGEPLEPIRFVERCLTHPDGTQVTVRVPVYPCFRVESWPPRPEELRHLGTRAAEPETTPSDPPELLEFEDDAA